MGPRNGTFAIVHGKKALFAVKLSSWIRWVRFATPKCRNGDERSSRIQVSIRASASELCSIVLDVCLASKAIRAAHFIISICFCAPAQETCVYPIHFGVEKAFMAAIV